VSSVRRGGGGGRRRGGHPAAAGSKAASAKVDRQRIRELERDLGRKDRALAETAALLILRKKAAAIWGEDEAE
jgi:hypothetical protein